MKVTGIGSLPHDGADEAAGFVLATTTIPYLPQLPHRHPEEGMLRQWGDGLCGCGAAMDDRALAHGAAVGPRREAFGGARHMLELLQASPPPLVKTQATGPVTLALAMRGAGHPGPGLVDCLVEGLQRRIGEHVASIHAVLPGTEVVVLLDEPALGAVVAAPRFPVSRAAAMDLLQQVAAGVDATIGLHCCAETDWGWLAASGFDVLSFDLMTLGPGLGDAAGAIAEAVADGTDLMWGVVQPAPLPMTSESSLLDTFRSLVVELVVAGVPVERLVDDAWFTPACGLAGLSPSHAAWVMDQVRKFADAVAEPASP